LVILPRPDSQLAKVNPLFLASSLVSFFLKRAASGSRALCLRGLYLAAPCRGSVWAQPGLPGSGLLRPAVSPRSVHPPREPLSSASRAFTWVPSLRGATPPLSDTAGFLQTRTDRELEFTMSSCITRIPESLAPSGEIGVQPSLDLICRLALFLPLDDFIGRELNLKD